MREEEAKEGTGNKKKSGDMEKNKSGGLLEEETHRAL